MNIEKDLGSKLYKEFSESLVVPYTRDSQIIYLCNAKYAKFFQLREKTVGMTAIQRAVYMQVWEREFFGLRQLPQREMAVRIGCNKQSVVNALKALKESRLLKLKVILRDYKFPNAYKWRNTYETTDNNLGKRPSAVLPAG